MRELTYYVAVTLDGFIAGPSGDLDVFPAEGDHLPALAEEYPETFPGHLRDPLGIDDPNRHFDSVLMGRRTYEPALDLGIVDPYPHLDQHVVSRTLAHDDDTPVVVVRDDPLGHVRELKRRDGLGIWLCGGGELAAAVAPEIDELVLKVNPVAIGEGIPLFAGPVGPTTYRRVASTQFDSGVTLSRYRR